MKLSIFLDENVPPSIARFLIERRPDWTVVHVQNLGLKGASDHVIFTRAQQERAIVITFDEDFADARMHPAGGHAGVIRLRVWPTTIEATEVALERLLATTDDEVLVNSLVIVDDVKIRIRRSIQHG